MKKKVKKAVMEEVLELARAGKSKECGEKAVKVIRDYGLKIGAVINPFPTADAPFIIMALRHIANSLENSEPNTKRMYEAVASSIKLDKLEITKTPIKAKRGLHK